MTDADQIDRLILLAQTDCAACDALFLWAERRNNAGIFDTAGEVLAVLTKTVFPKACVHTEIPMGGILVQVVVAFDACSVLEHYGLTINYAPCTKFKWIVFGDRFHSQHATFNDVESALKYAVSITKGVAQKILDEIAPAYRQTP